MGGMHIRSPSILLLLLMVTPLYSSMTIRDSLYSESMDKEIKYAIVLPESYNQETKKIFPVLYALHGMGSPYDTWAVMNPLNRAIDRDYPAIIVTFDGGNEWFVDARDDPAIRYTTFFFDELVPFVETTYRAGRHPGRRAVTGFSMGGFGAWHLTLEDPTFFSSVSALSGGFNYSPFGVVNPYARIETMASESIALPPFYLHCGSDDWLLPDSRNMAQHLEDNGFSATLLETPGYGHTWAFWRDSSDELIAWHYPFFSDPDNPGTWRGFPLQEEGMVDTGTSMGWLYVEMDPWVWVYKLSGWAYLDPGWPDGTGGWMYLPQ